MAEEKDGQAHPDAEPSPGTRAFIARRAAMAEASAADAAVEAAQREQRQAQQQENYHNPFAILAGVAVLALLLLGFVFIVDRLRSDPWFSDCPTGQGACR